MSFLILHIFGEIINQKYNEMLAHFRKFYLKKTELFSPIFRKLSASNAYTFFVINYFRKSLISKQTIRARVF